MEKESFVIVREGERSYLPSRSAKTFKRYLKIFDLRISGMSFPEIAKRLYANSVKKDFYTVFQYIEGKKYTPELWQKYLKGGI